MRIDVCGRDGSNGSRGSSGCGYGSNGGPGSRGQDGANSRDISISIQCQDGRNTTVSGTHAGRIPFSENIAMHATGGHGGCGGDGGSGASGYPGSAGSNATQYSAGGNGGAGGPGGDGGRGGDGGHGGNGGHVEVVAVEDDMDLFMVCERAEIRKGKGGSGGSGGSGGAGGPGGPGGSGYTWTESKTSYVNGQSQTTYVTHSQPGGCSGPSGTPGSRGANGTRGKDGKDGSFFEKVCYDSGQATRYTWRYVAAVRDVALTDTTTDDSIIEPGDVYETRHVVLNTGPMPTPSKQTIYCSIDATKWVRDPTTTHVMDRLVQQNYRTHIKAPIRWNVQRVSEPPPNTFLHEGSQLKWNVWVERVSRRFNVQETGDPLPITVQYPERMSPLHGPATISRAEFAPLTTCTHNHSSRSIGSEVGRVLYTEACVVTDPNSMRPLENDFQARLADPDDATVPLIHQDALRHDPQRNLFTTTSLRFGVEAPLYSRSVVAFSLHIGDVGDFMNPKRIQRMSREIQLAEYYGRRSGSNLLVVVNHTTSKESYDTWCQKMPHLGFKPNFWNATLHDGLSLEQEVNGSCVANDFVHRTIVVENNDPGFLTALSTDRNARNEFPMDTISGREITRAMVKGRIGICVFGTKCDLRKKLIPADLRITPFPAADSARAFIERLSDQFWLDRFDFLSFRNNLNVTKDTPRKIMAAHKALAKVFGKGKAWNVLWGRAVADHGDEHRDYDAGIRLEPFFSYDMRLERYMNQRAPQFTSAVLEQFRKNKKVHQNRLIRELAPYLGEELEHSNRYVEVSQVVFGQLTLPIAKKIMVEESRKTHAKITAIRPQWKFIVSYEVAPYLIQSNAEYDKQEVGGVMLKAEKNRIAKRYIGRMFILRASDRNGAVVQHLPHHAGAIQPDAISSPSTAYALYKARPFSEKISIAMRDASSVTFGGSLASALLSDLVEEQFALRRFNWSRPVADACLLDHVPRLCAILGVLGPSELIIDVVVDVTPVIERWVYWEDRIMAGRRRAILTAKCTDLIYSFLRHHAPKKWSKALSDARKRASKYSLEDLVETTSGGVISKRDCSNMESQFKVKSMPMMEYINEREKPPQVVTNRWVLDEPRERLLVQHKLRCGFNGRGELERVTRDAQHQELDFISCPGGHNRFVDVREEVHDCGICGPRCQVPNPATEAESVAADDGGINVTVPMAGASEASAAKRCNSCGFVVCGHCWDLGNNPRWKDWR